MFDIRRLFAVPRPRRRERPPVERGLKALARGRHDQALAYFAEALALDLAPAERAFVHNKRGIALIGCGDREAAEAAFREALASVDDYAPALVNLGNLRLDAGVVDEAVAYYNAALSADPDHPGAHFNLGVALKRAGRTAEGVHHLRQAQRLSERRRS